MAVMDYTGTAISGWQGMFINLRERHEKNDPLVTKETFVQLKQDLGAFLEKHASAGFSDKFPIEGASSRLKFPPITKAEALAMGAKARMVIG